MSRMRHRMKTTAAAGVTRRVLADRLSVHMQTITKWEREGMPIAERGRKGKASLYSAADVRAWLKAREKAAQTGGQVDVSRERARKERAQAELIEQMHQARSRELLPADEVEKAVTARVMAARTTALAWKTMLVDRLELANTTEGRLGMQRVIDAQVDEFLLELSGGIRVAAPTGKRRKGRAA